MTAESTRFIHVIYIATTPQKVFEAITRPEIARAYWGHENVSDWAPGSRWQHVRANEERKVELVGEVVESTPPSRLVITWAAASQADDPKAYSRVTFEIVPAVSSRIALSTAWAQVVSSMLRRWLTVRSRTLTVSTLDSSNTSAEARCACSGFSRLRKNIRAWL